MFGPSKAGVNGGRAAFSISLAAGFFEPGWLTPYTLIVSIATPLSVSSPK
jgi:hypothetical protein